MVKQCVKCGYLRQKQDTAPEYECPRCGVVYAKATLATDPIPQCLHWEVALLDSGKPKKAKMHRMFGTHGPFMIGALRLDRLDSVEILRDASTVTTYTATLGETATNTGSLVSRAVAGQILAGPVGAIIGGSTAKATTTSAAISNQVANPDVYLAMKFRNIATNVIVQLHSDEAFRQILASVGQKECTPVELAEMEALSKIWQAEQERRNQTAKHDMSAISIGMGLVLAVSLLVVSLLLGPTWVVRGVGVVTSAIVVAITVLLFRSPGDR